MKKNNDKILTILIPVYNTEKYIKRCLDSVLIDEIAGDIEVIVVSDGSKDCSIEIARTYLNKFSKTLKIIEKKNGGHGSTINVGIEEASGKYFKVLDSDDWFNITDFIEFVKRLKSENSDLVVTNYRQEHVYSGNSVFYKYENLEDNKKYIFDNIDLNLLNGEYFVMATSTYKTKLLRDANVKLFEKTFYVDMQYNIMPIVKTNNFTYYDLDIYRYFVGRMDQSVNVSSFVKNQDSHEKVARFMIDFYENNNNILSNTKKQYLQIIIKYMLNTHYAIYCQYDDNKKNSYSKIKKFDKDLKTSSVELYSISNKIFFIRVFRKTNFIFVKHFSKLFLKCCNLLRRVGD